MQDLKQRDRIAFQLAREFMHDIAVQCGTDHVLEKYLRPECVMPQVSGISGLYYLLLFHAQNANMKSGVIGKSIGGVDKLSPVLFGFDPQAVLSHFRTWEDVLDKIEADIKPRGQIRRNARSIWPSYSKTILSAASFISKFATVEDFDRWVKRHDGDPHSRLSLPLQLEAEIHGYGFALACDFLKELGYQNFAKPDVHIKEIFFGLGLTSTTGDIDVFRAVTRVAETVGESPYYIDKLFWLIASGHFYDHVELGNKGRIGSNKAQFLNFALPQLETAART